MDRQAASSSAIQTAADIATDCIGARIRMLNRTISRIYDEEIRGHGIKFSQMNILTMVTLHGPVQQLEIARLLSLEKSTLSRNVALMEANGWIEVLPGHGNSRLLQVTVLGRRLLEKAAPGWRAAQARVEALLGTETATAVGRAADRIWAESRLGA